MNCRATSHSDAVPDQVISFSSYEHIPLTLSRRDLLHYERAYEPRHALTLSYARTFLHHSFNLFAYCYASTGARVIYGELDFNPHLSSL